MKPASGDARNATAAATSRGSPKRRQRDLALDPLLLLMRILAPVAFGIDGAGRDGVDGDAVGAELAGERLGEAVQAGLAGDVVGAMGHLSPEAVEPGDEDDAAPMALAHVRDGVAGEIERGAEVGAQHRVPIRRRDVEEGLIAPDAYVRDQDVDRAEGLRAGRDQPCGVRILRHVRHHADAPCRQRSLISATTRSTASRSLEPLTTTAAPFLGQRQCDAASDIPARAGDDRGAACKLLLGHCHQLRLLTRRSGSVVIPA